MGNLFHRLALFCVCILGWNATNAGCLPGVPPPTLYVGSDNQCDYTTVQAAISSVSTTATCAPVIYITDEHKPWNESLTISNRSLSLIGISGACSVGGTHRPANVAAATSPQATLSGAGRNAPVITIHGNSHVTLQALEITGANLTATNAEGGGIFFDGSGSLTLSATLVDANQADYGGGIDISPIGTTTLTLQENAQVLNNTARTSGGGIRIEGQTRLFMLADGSTVSFNKAQSDYGGGIEIIGPARADIGSSGAVFVGAVSNNSAPIGGGIAVLASSTGNATARVFSTNAAAPVLISNNTASNKGGAFYLKPDAQNDAFKNAILCAYNFRIDSNTAPDGAAIFGDGDTDNTVYYGTGVSLNPSSDCGPESPSSLGAVACAAGTPCNEISGNDAVDNGGIASGAIVTMTTYAFLGVQRTQMRGNFGKHLLFSNSDYENNTNSLQSCLLVDNHTTQELIYSDSGFLGEALIIANCTIANNTIDSGYVIFARSLFELTDTIVDQPNTLTINHQTGDCEHTPCTFKASYVMSNDISTLPVSSNIIVIDAADPLFVDATNGNYRLAAFYRNGRLVASRAIDFAPTVTGDAPSDFDNTAYTQDVPAVPDAYGTRDLGAYEMSPINDRIFGDGFGDPTSIVY